MLGSKGVGKEFFEGIGKKSFKGAAFGGNNNGFILFSIERKKAPLLPPNKLPLRYWPRRALPPSYLLKVLVGPLLFIAIHIS